MLTVVCFKWFDPRGRYNDRVLYTAEHVNSLKRMVRRHLSLPHRFVCITDDEQGLDPDIRPVPIDGRIVSAAGNRYPKLMIFRTDAADWLGDRILMLDLDTVVVNTLDSLVSRDEDFVAWKDPNWDRNPKRGKFNSSMVLLRAGSHPEVWNSFEAAIGVTVNSGHVAYSDQAWIWRALGENHPVWSAEDGVLSFKRNLLRRKLITRKLDLRKPTVLPPGARIVFFHGGIDPRRPDVQARHGWIREHLA